MPKQRTYQRLKDHINLAYGVLVSAVPAMFVWEDVKLAWQADRFHCVLYVALLVVTIGRCLSYFHAVNDELDTMAEIYEEQEVPRIRHVSLIFSVGLSLAFGASIYFSNAPLIYSSIAIVLQLLDFGGVSITISKIYQMTERSFRYRELLDEKVLVLFKYYILRPQMQRCVIILLLFVAAWVVALLSKYEQSDWFDYAPYLILIVAVVANEAVMWVWRAARDRQFDELAADA